MFKGIFLSKNHHPEIMIPILPDKDAPVDETLANITHIFDQLDLSLHTASECHPLTSCWSHHIILDDCRELSTNGKGGSKNASLASGFAEMVERFATGALFAEYALSRKDCPFYFHPQERSITIKKRRQPIQKQKYPNYLLTPELLEFYDPEKELLAAHLMDANYGDEERGILSLPFTPLLEEEEGEVWFPVALLNNLYATNGLAAGNSRWECLNQALCEVFERYVKYTVISQGVALPDFPKELLQQYPQIMEQYLALEESGCTLWVKDASLDGSFPVVCVLLLDPIGGAFASFGSSCYIEVALGRAFTEMLQGKELWKLQGFPRPETTMSAFANSSNLEQHFINSEGLVPLRLFRSAGEYPFASDFWGALEKNRGTESRSEYRYLCRLVEQAGYYAYKLEYDFFGFSACRIVVPGMSEVYPVDELLWNNCNRGAWLRGVLLKLPKMKEKKLSQFAERLELAEFSAEELISSLIGIVFAKDSVWGQLRLGELYALLYLAIFSRQEVHSSRAMDSAENAQHWCRWVVEYSGLKNKRVRIYILLEQLLAIVQEGENWHEYKPYFLASFSLEELMLAEDILSGKVRFWGLDFGACWEDVSSEYKDIMEKFSKYQQSLCKK